MDSVLYACDQNYIIQTAISMVSLLENNRDSSLVIYLVEDGVKKTYLRALRKKVKEYQQKLMILDGRKLFSSYGFRGDMRHARTIYAKLLIEEIGISTPYVLYLDSDTIVNQSLQKLFAMRFSEYVAGVMMPYSAKKKEKLGGKSGIPFLCDGVLMIHARRWKEEGMGKRCVQYMKEMNWNPPGLSEGVLNHVCSGEWKIIPPSYNLMGNMIAFRPQDIKKIFQAEQYYKISEIKEAVQRPYIIHFLSELYERPWIDKNDHPYAYYYQKYKKISGFWQRVPDRRKLSLKTRLVRTLYHCMPISVFCFLYHRNKRKK